MRKGTSLYLDLVRFSAALIVFLEHFREHTRNGFSQFWKSHPFWFFYLNPYSQTAVIVFFVLSGYVIAHVLATRETTPIEYATSRLGRLYSVVVPALILTFVTNFLEAMRVPHAFDSYGGPVAVFFEYLGTAFFVSHFWLWRDLEPANSPFWSLSFEAAYYVAIGLFVFMRGNARFLSLLLLAALAGPTMILLAPTWLLGYATYHLAQRRRFPAGAAAGLWLASAVLLAMSPLVEIHFRQPLAFLRIPDGTVGGLLASYSAALCFAVNVFAFDALSDRLKFLLLPVATPIRWLGSMTFALYLFHQPMLSFFTVYGASDRSSPLQALLLIGGTFLVVATLGHFCEQAKTSYKGWFLSLWQRSAGLRLRYAQTP